MEYREEIMDDKSIIIIYLQGVFDFDEIVSLGIRYRKRALERGYRLICDFRNARGNVSVSDIQTYFSNHIHPVDERLSRVPVVYISSERGYPTFKLLQQIWENQGVSIVVFKDLDLGIKWFETHNLP